MPEERESTTTGARTIGGEGSPREIVVVRFSFPSFAKLCLLISTHVGALAGILFFFTNGGRRVSFGTAQCVGARADVVGSLFLLFAITLLVGLVGMVAFLPIHALLRLTGGMRLKALSRDSTPGDRASP